MVDVVPLAVVGGAVVVGLPGLPMRMVTVEPGATCSPAPGVWSMTTLDCGEPNGTSTFTTCDLRLAFCNASRAADSVAPTTFGTWTGVAPDETTSTTVEPLSTWVPAGGSVRMTVPAATVSLASLCSVVTRPRPPSWLAAATEGVLATLGIETFGRPLETVSLTTVLPGTG